MELRDIIKKVLREQKEFKDEAFKKMLKKIIPDNSIYDEFSYSLPYSEEGIVHVIMKYSTLPGSRLMKMIKYNENGDEDGTYDGIHLEIQANELLWKSDYDPDYEKVRKLRDLPNRFYETFEDEMSDKFKNTIGIGYVDVIIHY